MLNSLDLRLKSTAMVHLLFALAEAEICFE